MGASIRLGLTVVMSAALGFAAGHYSTTKPSASATLTQMFATAGGPTAASRPSSDGSPKRSAPTTLAEIMNLRGDFMQTAALYLLASSVDRNGLERLLGEAAAIKQDSERRAATSILYSRYAELDPEAAVEHMLRRQDFEMSWLQSAFHTWARADLDAALARAARLDPMSKSAAGAAVLNARDDLPRQQRETVAAQLDMRLPPKNQFRIDVRTPEAAERSWRAALAIADDRERMNRLMTIASAWSRQDPEAAMQAIALVEERQTRDQLIQMNVQAWAQRAPRAAVDWVFAQPVTPQRTRLLAVALSGMAISEPSSALDLALGLSSPERRQVLPQIVQQWASRDPRSAATWVERLDDAGLRKTMLGSVATSYSRSNPEEALRWAASLPAADQQNTMSAVINAIAWTDPARASGLVNNLTDLSMRDSAARSIAQAWAQRDPKAALAWTAKFPAGDRRGAMYQSIFSQWANFDVDAAVAHLEQIEDPTARSMATMGVLSNSYLETDTIDRLYQRIEGANARRAAAMSIYYAWRERDPNFAERYRAEAGIREGRERALSQ